MGVDLEKLKFPIGEFHPPSEYTEELVNNWIAVLENFPIVLSRLVGELSEEQLTWKYRPEGWNVKQVVHHCADSHMNSIIRFKLALTEENPTIKPYFEDKWAELEDTLNVDVSFSLEILKGVHFRWVSLLKSLSKAQMKRSFVHPEHGSQVTIQENIGIYAWHCQHHLAHIKNALEAGGKY